MKKHFAFLEYLSADGIKHTETVCLQEINMKPIAGTKEAIYNGQRITIVKFIRL